jgi:hypothetical protein
MRGISGDAVLDEVVIGLWNDEALEQFKLGAVWTILDDAIGGFGVDAENRECFGRCVVEVERCESGGGADNESLCVDCTERNGGCESGDECEDSTLHEFSPMWLINLRA